MFNYQEKIAKLRANESRLEENKKALKMALDEAENRCTKLELGRRSLDGDLQRFKLVMNDKETENQVRGGSNFFVKAWVESSVCVKEGDG